MTHLALSLLGPFVATLDGEPLSDFESNKVRALLAFLGVENKQPQQRIELATLLWPDMNDAVALRNLRHALANLRRVLGDTQAQQPLLLVDRYTVQLNPAAETTVDVIAFRDYLAAATAPGVCEQEAISSREAAVALVRGEFLQGFRVRGSTPWEEWMLLRGEAYEQQLLQALRGLARAFERQGAYEQAQAYAQQWVQQAPWDEEAHRQLIRLLALDGRRAAALAQFEACCRQLQSRLSVEPAAETVALAVSIRDGAFPRPAPASPPTHSVPAGPQPALTPPRFVARQDELARLKQFWDAALTGESQFAFITGEAGSGKSALAAAFGRQVLADRADVVVVRGKCNAFAGQGDPFLPFRDILLALIGDPEALRRGGSMGEDYHRRLQRFIPTTIPTLVQNGPDLLDSLALTPALIIQTEAFLPQSARKKALLSQLQQHQAADATLSQSQRFSHFTQVLAQLAARHPLLLILDDLQWADAGSLSLLFHLGHRLQTSRIFLLGLFRSETVLASAASPQDKPHPLALILHELQRRRGDILIDLNRSAGRAFVDAYLDTEPNRLDEHFRSQLHRHTGGHALFTTELLASLQEQGYLLRDEHGWRSHEHLNWAQIPPRIEAIIAERIASLPAAWRTLLKVASIAGESFAAEVLAPALECLPPEVQHILDTLTAPPWRLVQFQSRTWSGRQMLNSYCFRHILFQDYLYGQLAEGERERWHEKIGGILEEIYAARGETIAPRLARHFEAAHLPLKAAAYYLLAGQRAMQLFAPGEALALYGRGLALLLQTPESAEKEEQEMALQMAISTPLLAMQGWGAPERVQASQRAYELCRQAGNEQALIQVMFMQADMLRAQGEHALSLQLGEQLLALAEQEGTANGLALAHWTLGETCFFQGNVARAHRHLTRALTFYTPSNGSLTPLTATDMGVVCHVWLAWLEKQMGHPEVGENHVQAALALARRLERPLSLIFALTLGAYGFHWLCGQPQVAAAYADELAPLMAQEALAGMHPWGQVFQGWVLAEEGNLNAGIAMMQAGLDAWQAMGAVCGRICQMIPLAEACGRAGQLTRARSLVEEALALVEQTGELMFEPVWMGLARRLDAQDAQDTVMMNRYRPP